MEKDLPWDKIGKYLAGECTPEERAQITTWIEADPDRKEILEELKEVWEQTDRQENWNTDRAWEEISGKLSENKLSEENKSSSLRLVESVQEELEKQKTNTTSRRRTWNWSYALSMVASVMLLAVVLFTFYLYNQGNGNKEADRTSSMEEVVTQKGQRSQFRLNDGTEVWLNAESRLKIPDKFNSNRRIVKLEGEAFFSVEPDSTRPFIIQAGHSVTKVLGTRFNVHAYPDENIEVVVEEGKVAFGNNREDIDKAPKLVRNQMGILAQNGRREVKMIQDLDRYLGWRKGRLVFRDTPFPVVMKKLERWYDIKCSVVDSSLNGRTVTGTFRDESMTEVLNIISLSLGAEYIKENRSVTFILKR